MKIPCLLLASIFVFLFASLSAAGPSSSQLVTAADYVVFLNAVAATDPYNLYNEAMSVDPLAACIIREGTPGSFHYFVIEGRENFSINYINEFAQQSFLNWSQNILLSDGEKTPTSYIASNKTDFSMELENSDTLSLLPFQQKLKNDLATYASYLSPAEQRAAGAALIGLLAFGLHAGFERYSTKESLDENFPFLTEPAIETEDSLLESVQQNEISARLSCKLDNLENRKTLLQLAAELETRGNKLYQPDLPSVPLAEKLSILTDKVKKLATYSYREEQLTNAKKNFDEHLTTIESLIGELPSELKGNFTQHHGAISKLWEEFPATEARSAEEAKLIAQKILEQLNEQQKRCASEKTRINSIKVTKEQDLTSYQAKRTNLTTLKNLKERLKFATSSSQIISNYKAREAASIIAYQALEDLCSELKPLSTEHAAKKELLLVLTTLREKLNLFVPPITTPQQFLRDLFDGKREASSLSAQIRGVNGKIILYDPPKQRNNLVFDQDDGLNLIRLAISDSQGQTAREVFDYQYQLKHPLLTGNELQEIFRKSPRTFAQKYFLELQGVPDSLHNLHVHFQDVLAHESGLKIIELLNEERKQFNPFSVPLNNNYLELSILHSPNRADFHPRHHASANNSSFTYDDISSIDEHSEIQSIYSTDEPETIDEFNSISNENGGFPIAHAIYNPHNAFSREDLDTETHESIKSARTILEKVISENTEKEKILARFDDAFKSQPSATVQNFSDFIAKEVEIENQRIAEQNRLWNRMMNALSRINKQMIFQNIVSAVLGGIATKIILPYIPAPDPNNSTATDQLNN